MKPRQQPDADPAQRPRLRRFFPFVCPLPASSIPATCKYGIWAHRSEFAAAMNTSDFMSATRNGALTRYELPLLARIRNGSNGSLDSRSRMTFAIMDGFYPAP